MPLTEVTRRKPVSDFQAIADRVEIEALRGELLVVREGAGQRR